MKNRIIFSIQESIRVKSALLADAKVIEAIQKIADECCLSIRNGGCIYFCGNGGSAADAQHLAAELSGRFYFDRAPLPAEALHVNTSYVTAVANDYSYDEIFSRYIRGRGRKGDVLLSLSTSGNSKNVCLAAEAANERGMITIGLTGAKEGRLKSLSKICIQVPSADTPRIQECHILLGHVICELIEAQIFKEEDLRARKTLA